MQFSDAIHAIAKVAPDDFSSLSDILSPELIDTCLEQATGHDYMPDGREPQWQSTVREHNKHRLGESSETEYVELRHRRDGELPMPKLILHALQVNILGGRLPDPEDNDKRYLKIPLDALVGASWE